MSNWKSIIGCLLAAAAALMVGGSMLAAPQAQPRTTDRIIFAAVTFFSVIVLHWLLWRFIIPSPSTAPAEVTSFFSLRSGRGFFSGTIGFGYVQVTIYCAELSGYVLRFDPNGRVGFLLIGLFLIGLGTVTRLRDAFSALSAPHDRPNPN
ncbi:MAG: hypothetical protein JWL90_3610 [Chthoniobacteraceae bacterium]|nr:hypothetical protein [Chthoniobacteraceae bacterium]